MQEVIDLTANTPPGVYIASRGVYRASLLLLHDTVGSTQPPDRNDLGHPVEGYPEREKTTIRWFQGGGWVSIHYLVGPEP